MNTELAFKMALIHEADEHMVFDWDLAARIIAKRRPTQARAGLRGDWEWTGGTIYENGKAVINSYTYLESNWATPELEMDGEVMPCYVMKSLTKWDAETKWPKSALKILKEEMNHE